MKKIIISAILTVIISPLLIMLFSSYVKTFAKTERVIILEVKEVSTSSNIKDIKDDIKIIKADIKKLLKR